MEPESYDDPLPGEVPGPQDHPGLNDNSGVSKENINEATFLLIIAGLGFIFNIAVVICIVTCKHLRRMTSAFIVHGCALDILKCLYCIPFATSLLNNVAPNFCTVLGGSYIVIVTASGFNIVAMICCEAYTFSEHNIGGDGKGSLCCVIFGVVMVYIGSIIIHLGPTIIGGEFKYNNKIGNCIFYNASIKSYVVHAMWIVIMTIAMVGSVYYLCYFYKHVQANSTHRLASLVRASIQISQGDASSNNKTIRKVVRNSLSRARVLITVTLLFIVSWYPLFILTLVDPKVKQPSKVYKLLTCLAWSNATINPLIYILFDRNINIFQRIKCCMRIYHSCCCFKSDGDADSNNDQDEQTAINTARNATTTMTGNRLGTSLNAQRSTTSPCLGAISSNNNSPSLSTRAQSITTASRAHSMTSPFNSRPNSRSSMLRHGNSLGGSSTGVGLTSFCTGGEEDDDITMGSHTWGGHGRSRDWETNRRTPPRGVFYYERVGCRLCNEGQHHSSEHCNGGITRLHRQSPVCEIHEIHSYEV